MTDLVTALLEAKQDDLAAVDAEIRELEKQVEKLRKARAVLAILFDDRPASAVFPAPPPVTSIPAAVFTSAARAAPAEVAKPLSGDDPAAVYLRRARPVDGQPSAIAEQRRKAKEFLDGATALLSDGRPRALEEIAVALGLKCGGPLAARLQKTGFVKRAGKWTIAEPAVPVARPAAEKPREPFVPALPPVVPVREEIRLAVSEVPNEPPPPIVTLPAKLDPPEPRRKPPPLPPDTKRHRLFRDRGDGDQRATLVASFDDAAEAQSECDRITAASGIIHYLFDAGA